MRSETNKHDFLTTFKSSTPLIYEPFKAPIDIVRHEQKHAELFKGDELHVALVALPRQQPF